MSKAARAWEEFMRIPPELAPTHLLQEAHEFPQRQQVYSLARSKNTLRNGTLLLLVPWIWAVIQIWVRALAPIISGETEGGYGRLILATMQLLAFVAFAIVGQTKIVTRMQENESRYPASPRMLFLATLACISPLALVIYQPYYDFIYSHGNVSGFAHPYLIGLVIFLIFDLARGFHWRLPACFGLTISWLIAGLFPLGFYSDRVEIATREARGIWLWPLVAILQTIFFTGIQILDHKIRQQPGYAGKTPPQQPATPPEQEQEPPQEPSPEDA